jgi:hypothetical protein
MIGIFMGIAGVSSDQQGGPHQWLLQRRIEVADELLRVLSVTDELAKTSWPDPDLRHSLSDVTPDLSQNQRDRIAGAGRI